MKPISWLASSATRNAAKVDSGRPARISSACRLAPPRSCSSALTRACGRPDNSASAQSNRSRLPDSSARRIRPAVSWPVARRCRTRPAMSSPRERAAMFTVERSRASLVMRPARSADEPVAGDDELRQRVGEFCDQRRAGRGRQTFQHQHRFPDRGEMAVALDDAVPRERRQLGIGIFDQFERGRRRADFGDRGANRGRQIRCGARWRIASRCCRSRRCRRDRHRSAAANVRAWAARPRAGRARAPARSRPARRCCGENTSAMAWRTSGEASSSSINSAPSAAARSSSERSEISQARASDRVASARSPAGAVLIQLINCRTIMVLPAYAT